MDEAKEKTRSSNIELFRIILMLAIIVHHYVVNSGIARYFAFNSMDTNTILAQMFGWGVKLQLTVS